MLSDWRDAPWWNPNNPQDGSPLVRHAPDDNNYHYPDGRQLERMRSGSGMPVVVPRARHDGRSMGFDPGAAGVVHVDPDAPDGGTVVDLSRLDKQTVNQALYSSQFPHEVFYKLGTSPRAAGQPQQPGASFSNHGFQRDAGYNPGYVVPRSNNLGQQVWEPAHQAQAEFGNYSMAYPAKEVQMLPAAPPLPGIQNPHVVPGQSAAVAGPAHYPAPQPQPQPPPQLQPQPPQYPYPPPPASQPQPYYAPPPPPAYDPNTQNALSQMLAGLQAISGRLTALEQRPPPAAPSPLPSFHPGAMASMPAVQTAPVGRDPTSYSGPGHLARVHYPPARSGPRKKQSGDNPYAADDPNQKAVFADEATPIGMRPQGQRGTQTHTAAEEYDERPQRLSDLEMGDDPRDGLLVGFEELRIPYVTGPKPMKPRRRVFFEFPGRGKQSALYHDVIVSEKSVNLVYDTRYEEGTQFEPPAVETDNVNPQQAVIKLHVPHLKKTFDVILAGISFNNGCFDYVVLPLVESEELDYEEKA